MIHGVFEAIATYVHLRGSLTATHFTVYPYGWVALRGKKDVYGCGELLGSINLNCSTSAVQRGITSNLFSYKGASLTLLLVRSENTRLLNYCL